MRLINADDIVYESIDSSDTCRHERYYGTGILAVRKEDIDAMQTIEECKKGKWIYTPTEPLGYTCSVCGKGCCRFNFCPNCGFRMERDNQQ